MHAQQFEDKRILITGGTGFIARPLTRALLNYNPHSIRLLARGEKGHVSMKQEFSDALDRLRFLIGDVRDVQRMQKAMQNVDIVFHLAALKHVDLCERDPSEAILTNVLGTQNVVNAAINANVGCCITTSSDKGPESILLYGASKLCAERITIAGNFHKGDVRTKFVCTRYGNVWWSSGAVQERWLDSITKTNKLHITDPKMTRFNITPVQAVETLLTAATTLSGGEVLIPRLKAYNLSELAEAFIEVFGNEKTEIIEVGKRDFEKTHELLISKDEIHLAYDAYPYYVILPGKELRAAYGLTYNYPPLPPTMVDYSSKDVPKLTKSELIELIKQTGV